MVRVLTFVSRVADPSHSHEPDTLRHPKLVRSPHDDDSAVTDHRRWRDRGGNIKPVFIDVVGLNTISKQTIYISWYTLRRAHMREHAEYVLRGDSF